MGKMADGGAVASVLGVRGVLNEGYHLLGNPFVVIDTSYNLLASTENTVGDDALWNELVANGRFAHTTVDFFNSAQFIQKVADADVVALLTDERIKYDRACGKFFDGDGIQLGSIVVVACYRPFEEEDFALINRVCERISEELQRGAERFVRERVFREDYICELLDGTIGDAGRMELWLQTLYADLKPNIFVAVADISQYERTLSHLAYMRDVFAKLQPEYQYFVYLNSVVILMSSDNPWISVKKDMDVLGEFFMRYTIYAGVSGGFQNLFELQKYYRQAMHALNRGTSQPSGQRIFRHESFITDYFLRAAKDKLDISELCHPIITQIMEYDGKNGTGYANALRAYLLTGQNFQPTCELTGLAPRRLRAILHDLEDIFEVDFFDGNLLYSLFIAFKALDSL